jgi:hypothetical protein
MSKNYWLNKDKNSIDDIIKVHKKMEEADCVMGSSHKVRLSTMGSFNYHFKFQESGKRYLSALYVDNDESIQKSAEWFLKFIDNNFIEPIESKYIDNSSESSTDTFLDKQLKTINN